ncbi:hypothetical protein VHEMI09766 [[Torrubiella] hemipterigena]|uniref:Uncharacterized protein n=1 Tax=[Torrubiella] hemipterigena TaxID=1531966 RepID=A0A0A1TS56_9HYPO|nr:hypothetical protein VHEMI09766 [[Torrubiella] hemipterigena]
MSEVILNNSSCPLGHLGSALVVDSRGVSVVSPSEPFNTSPEWTRKDLALYKQCSQEFSTQLARVEAVVAAITQSAIITGAVCVGGGPIACIAVGVLSILANFASIFVPVAGPDKPAGALPAIGMGSVLIHEDFQPTEAASTFDMLQESAQEGEWMEYGNSTVHGVHHKMHFRKQGRIMAIRATSATGASHKRDDNNDEGHIVSTYFWEDNNRAAWNDLQGTDLHPVADFIAQFVVDKNADISCADLITDTDGPIDVGVLTVHNNGQELGLMQHE